MYDELIKALRGPYDSRTDIQLMKQAADAIEELQAYVALYKDGGETAMKVAKEYQEQIEALRAADVRPVVRGKWVWTVDDDEYLGEYWKCNLCGEHSYIGYNYCPNCGADMRNLQSDSTNANNSEPIANSTAEEGE